MSLVPSGKLTSHNSSNTSQELTSTCQTLTHTGGGTTFSSLYSLPAHPQWSKGLLLCPALFISIIQELITFHLHSCKNLLLNLPSLCLYLLPCLVCLKQLSDQSFSLVSSCLLSKNNSAFKALHNVANFPSIISENYVNCYHATYSTISQLWACLLTQLGYPLQGCPPPTPTCPPFQLATTEIDECPPLKPLTLGIFFTAHYILPYAMVICVLNLLISTTSPAQHPLSLTLI